MMDSGWIRPLAWPVGQWDGGTFTDTGSRTQHMQMNLLMMIKSV